MALSGVAEDQAIPGPRHADVEQTALFRHRGLVGLVPMEWQQAVLKPDDEYDRKLEPLGGMQGQERNAVGARIPEQRVRRERRRILQAHAIISARLRECAEALERDRRAVHGVAALCQAFGGGAQFIEKRRRLAAVAEFPQQRLDRRFVRERSMGILLVRYAGAVEGFA